MVPLPRHGHGQHGQTTQYVGVMYMSTMLYWCLIPSHLLFSHVHEHISMPRPPPQPAHTCAAHAHSNTHTNTHTNTPTHTQLPPPPHKHTGTPWSCDPRASLSRVLHQLHTQHGLQVRLGFEHEFVLLHKPLDAQQQQQQQQGVGIGRVVPPAVDGTNYAQTRAVDMHAHGQCVWGWGGGMEGVGDVRMCVRGCWYVYSHYCCCSCVYLC